MKLGNVNIEGLILYPKSWVEDGDTVYFIAILEAMTEKFLCVSGNETNFQGYYHYNEGPLLCRLTTANAAELRRRLPWLKPKPLGTQISFGFGDRLGLATPGHIHAVEDTRIAPIFAQQSVRENARTGRTPQQVMDDAMWGVFQESWQLPWGADADHVKKVEDLPEFINAGYTFFTVDPGEHVDHSGHTAPVEELDEKAILLPWELLQTTLQETKERYTRQPFSLEGVELFFNDETLLRAVVKYGRAVAHAANIYQSLAAGLGNQPFDFEVSVDETETPTTIHEHFYIANELTRLGVHFISLAPRFIGRFEKGVDYISDLSEFERELTGHARILKYFGTYKLSLHSGSDKFSVYPSLAKHTNNRVHVKTAGTSYLEALRVLSREEPAFFRELLDFSRSRYETDRATYHVSADLTQVPPSSTVVDEALPDLLEQFDARQVLHVTFGSVLQVYGSKLLSSLAAHEMAYTHQIASHFHRHLAPFLA